MYIHTTIEQQPGHHPSVTPSPLTTSPLAPHPSPLILHPARLSPLFSHVITHTPHLLLTPHPSPPTPHPSLLTPLTGPQEMANLGTSIVRNDWSGAGPLSRSVGHL